MKTLERILYEPMSTLTHLAGVVASLVGLIILIYVTWDQPGKVLAVTVYGVSMMMLYGASSVFHGARVAEKTRMWLNRLDHMAIFLLIAGTYTPIVYTLTYGPLRGWLLGGVWVVNLTCMGYKLLSRRIHGFYNAIIYVVLSWGSAIPLLLFFDVTELIPLSGWSWLLLGGLIYSAGFVTYYFERPDPWPGVFGHHEVWHLFVLAGSLCHFLFILWYVVPLPPAVG